MFVTVVAILCHLVAGQSVCVEEIVTDSNMTEGLSLSDCMSGSQAPIAKWKGEHPTYHSAEWSIGRYKCVLGHWARGSRFTSHQRAATRSGARIR